MNVYLDIETIPDQRQSVIDYVSKNIEPPASHKKPETIEKWWNEESKSAIDLAYRKLSLDPWFAQIICVSFAIDDDDPLVYMGDGNEKHLLKNLFAALKAGIGPRMPTFVGSYIAYDLRTLFARSRINQVEFPRFIPVFEKPWSDRVYDTSNIFGDRDHRLSMERACLAFDIKGKGDFSGSMVYDAWKKGRLTEICEYCCDDVWRTRAIYKALTGNQS